MNVLFNSLIFLTNVKYVLNQIYLLCQIHFICPFPNSIYTNLNEMGNTNQGHQFHRGIRVNHLGQVGLLLLQLQVVQGCRVVQQVLDIISFIHNMLLKVTDNIGLLIIK